MPKLTKWDYIGIGTFLLLGSLSFKVHADWYGAVGRTEFQEPVNGVWRQAGYDNQSDLRDTAVRIGYLSILNRYVTVDAWGQWFGKSRIFSGWESDKSYLDDHRLGQDKTTYGQTMTSLAGAGVGLRLGYPLKQVTPFVESGLWGYRWQFDLKNSTPSDPNATTLNRWSCQNSGADWYYGTGIKAGRLSISVTHYRLNDSTHNGIGCWANFGGVTTVLLGMMF